MQSIEERREAQRRYYEQNKDKLRETQKAYNKENTTFIGLRFNNKSDWDVVSKIQSVASKPTYIRQLIRDDIKRTGFQVPPSPAELEAQEREAERLAEVEKYHQIRAEAAEANGSDGKPVQSGDSEAEARKLFGM